MTRREFIGTAALATGFAVAVQPVSAKTITTDVTGLIAGAVKIPVQAGEIPAYRAVPATGGNFPIVLVVQEISGVHAHIQDVTRRFAKQGYIAIAPELFALSNIDEVPDAQVLSELDTTVNWAAKSAQGNPNRLAITGFCWGGRITWLYAAHNPKVKTGVAWYGRLVGNATDLTPKHPIDLAPTLRTPIIGLYGGKDGGKDTDIPLDTVEQMRARLQSSRSEIVVYPDAPHAFFADYRPSYREADAKDGWKRLQAWFKQHGV